MNTFNHEMLVLARITLPPEMSSSLYPSPVLIRLVSNTRANTLLFGKSIYSEISEACAAFLHLGNMGNRH